MPPNIEDLLKGEVQRDYPPEPEPAGSATGDQQPRLLEVAYGDSSGREVAEISVVRSDAGVIRDIAGGLILSCQRSPEQEASATLAPVMAARGLREAMREMRRLERSDPDELLWYSCTSTYDAWNDTELQPEEYEYVTEWAADEWVYTVTADQESLRDAVAKALVATVQD